MWPGRVRTRGANMMLTTRTIGLLVTMAVVTGGAARGVHALIASAGGAGSDYGLDTNRNGKVEWNYTTRAYAVSEFEPPVRTAFFTGGHTDSAVDVDADGLADFLGLTADVHVNTAGHYSMYGTLSKESGSDAIRSIAYAYRDFNLTTDDTTVFLRFRGDQLRQTGLDGPWDFALTLFGPVDLPVVAIGPPTGGVLRPVPISYPETLCGSTRAYRATDFDDTVEFLRYTGRFEESTPDRDGHGKYDALVVRAEVDVLLGAGFAVSGVLHSVGGSVELARATGQLWLRDGLQWVEFVFPGPQIRGSGVDGPYEGMLSITPGPAGIDPTRTYITKAYRAADFDNESLGTRGYWISNVTATPTGSNLAIAVGVTRGPDMLALVFEDSLEVRVTNATGAFVGSFQTKVYLASSGTEQSFTFSVSGLSAGRYTVTVILGPESRPVDTRTVVVTV